MKRSVTVTAIWIDEARRLCMRTGEPLDGIYRAAAEVHWDPVGRFLYSPPPRQWTYGRWMQQFREAVRSEYGSDLVISADTTWDGVDDATRQELTRALTENHLR